MDKRGQEAQELRNQTAIETSCGISFLIDRGDSSSHVASCQAVVLAAVPRSYSWQAWEERMKTGQTALDTLRALLDSQRLAVVATQMPEGPYASLVAFAASDDLRTIAFVTSRATTKYRNLYANPNVSVLIDSRTHSVEDFSTGTAVTAVGRATDIPKSAAEATVRRFVHKHPHLEAFVQAPSTAICRVAVKKYYLVTRFQHVVELDVSQWSSSSP